MPEAELSLGADTRSAGVARRFLATTLSTWGDTAYSDDGALLLSELVTNAALHAKTPIVIRIALQSDVLHLAVTDGSPRHPVVRHYSDQSTTGRGLALVSALAVRWGIDPHPDGTKTVWAELGSRQSGRHDKEGAEGGTRAVPPKEQPPFPQHPGREDTSALLRTA